ncbi:MAG: DUF3969 family protein [Deltaproteobacteria bacterium]|nr:DUF3969 family protein [Deltaproteobacteria bacterium]
MEERAENSEQEHLILKARGSEDIQMLVAMVSLGMCRALADGAVRPEYACARLFGPALLTRMQRLPARHPLIDAVHVATELEDVANLVPDAFEGAIQDLEDHLLRVVRSLADLADGEKWLAPTGTRTAQMAQRGLPEER